MRWTPLRRRSATLVGRGGRVCRRRTGQRAHVWHRAPAPLRRVQFPLCPLDAQARAERRRRRASRARSALGVASLCAPPIGHPNAGHRLLAAVRDGALPARRDPHRLPPAPRRPTTRPRHLPGGRRARGRRGHVRLHLPLRALRLAARRVGAPVAAVARRLWRRRLLLSHPRHARPHLANDCIPHWHCHLALRYTAAAPDTHQHATLLALALAHAAHLQRLL